MRAERMGGGVCNSEWPPCPTTLPQCWQGAPLRYASSGRYATSAPCARGASGRRKRRGLPPVASQKAGPSAAEQEVYELLEEMGEADAGTLAMELSKHHTSVLRTLKRLRAQGSVEAREVATHNHGGRKILFRIAEEMAAKPWLAAV
jgi:DNA-binding transcriptional ArsR family regulator